MSNYWLLPRSPFWASDEVLLSTPNRNYTLDNLDTLFEDMGVTDGSKIIHSVHSRYTFEAMTLRVFEQINDIYI